MIEKDRMDESILNRNKNINRGFRKLDVWKEAIELFVLVKKVFDPLKSISFKIKAQLEDSIFLVHSNIAEGYCRRHLKETIQFNNIALALLGENYSQMLAIFEADCISKEIFDEFDSKHYSLENN